MPHVVESHNGLTLRGKHIPHLAVVTVSCREICNRIGERSAVFRRQSVHVRRLPGSELHPSGYRPGDKKCPSDYSLSFWIPNRDGRPSALPIRRYRAARRRRLVWRMSRSNSGLGLRHRETAPKILGRGFGARNRSLTRQTSPAMTPNPFACLVIDATALSPQMKIGGTQTAGPCPGTIRQDRTSARAWPCECR